MTMSLESAAQAMREAMRETVRRHSLWYLVQGALMVLAGLLALVYPVVSSVAMVLFLGWVLIISGVFQGISLIGAQHVPHFWLHWSRSCCRWSSGCSFFVTREKEF